MLPAQTRSSIQFQYRSSAFFFFFLGFSSLPHLIYNQLPHRIKSNLPDSPCLLAITTATVDKVGAMVVFFFLSDANSCLVLTSTASVWLPCSHCQFFFFLIVIFCVERALPVVKVVFAVEIRLFNGTSV